MPETPQEMAARADHVLAKCRSRGTASVADVANLNDGIHDLADTIEDLTTETDELAEELTELNKLPAQLEDARALAQALLNRLRDFIDDETAFGEGITWATLPDWLSGDDAGRAMWNYGAEEAKA